MKNTIKLTPEERNLRRIKFFTEMDKEYPEVPALIATNSGILEKFPETQNEWDNFHEHLQFVEGALGYSGYRI